MSILVDMQEWQTATPETNPTLEGVFLPADRETIQVVGSLNRSGKLSITELRHGLSISTTSFIGRVQLGNLQIIIRPKVKYDILLNLLRYAYHLRDLSLYDSATQRILPRAFQDLIIQQYRLEVGELISRGLRREYRKQREDLPTLRGRIDLQRIAQQGGVTSATLPVTHHSRLADNTINQVILGGLALAIRLTDDLMLRTQLRRLGALLSDDISRLPLTPIDLRLAQQQLNRLTSAYAPALTLIALMMQSAGIALDGDAVSSIVPGFLFDMNRFFEVLLGRFLAENLPDAYVLKDQYRLSTLLAYSLQHNPQHRRAPVPRPDYVVLKNNKTVAMLDAKYRDLWRLSLPREMLYQVGMYALSQGRGGQAVILYPTLAAEASVQEIQIHEITSGEQRATVVLRPVHLPAFDNLINAKGIKGERERVEYTRTLILG